MIAALDDFCGRGLSAFLLLALLLALPGLAIAEEQWFSVMLDGRKLGHATIEHDTSAEGTTETYRVVLALKGAGRPNKLAIEQRTEYAANGQALRYSTQVQTRDIDRRQYGSIDAETVALRTVHASIEQRDHLVLPKDVVWPMQETQKLKNAIAEGMRHLSFTAFDALLGLSMPVELDLDTDADAANGETPPTVHVRRRAQYPDHVAITTTDFDTNFRAQRIATEISGLPLQLVATTEALALAPDQPLDYLNRLLVRSPFRISHEAASRHIRYSLALRDGNALELPSTFEQRVRHEGTATIVDVCADCGTETVETAPSRETREANAWIQSDTAEIRTIAKNIGADADPRRRMRALTDYVRNHMRGRSEFLGYISALEAAKTGNGDCTAYALLLAALGRAAGIPTRVAVGMVYTERFNNRNDVFMPHAWAQAWIAGRWQSFDAATEGFDSTHIALAIGQGDPSRFSPAMSALAIMEMHSAAEVATKSRLQK